MLGKLRRKYMNLFWKQSMRTILYVLLVVMSIAIAALVGIFAVGIYQKDTDRLAEEDNRKLADQMNIAMSQDIHRLIQISDALYYDVIKSSPEYVVQMF